MLDDIAFIDLKSLPENTDQDSPFTILTLVQFRQDRFPTKTLFRERKSLRENVIEWQFDVYSETKLKPCLSMY